MGLRGLLREKIEKLKGNLKVEYPDVHIRDAKHIVALPVFREKTKLNVTYPLLEPYVNANIRWDKKNKCIVYNIKEPELTKKEQEEMEKIKKALLEVIDVSLSVVKKKNETFNYLKSKVSDIIDDENIIIGPDSYSKIMYFIFRDFAGLNEIEPLMHDPYIEDIGCDGITANIFVTHRRFGSIKTNIKLESSEKLSKFVIKLAERCGRYISYAMPLLDGSLPDGSRVQATLAIDVTTHGPTFSIRKFRHEPLSPIELINLNTASAELMAYLWMMMEYRTSLLICGGVSTGKTTILNAITMFISPENKIVSIEDTRELNLPHENWIPSVSRVGFGIPEIGGKIYGEVSLFDLLRESFRQNPDYVIVGEVRGKEAYVMFQGMASGHASMGTIHAGSVEDVIKRLETPPIELSPGLIETLDLLIIMARAREKGESARRVKEIHEIESIDKLTGNARTVKTFEWVPLNDEYEKNITESHMIRKISHNTGISYQEMERELKKRKKILLWMQKYDIIDFQEVSKYINLYYKDSAVIMKWVEKDIPPKKEYVEAKIRELKESASGLKMIED